MLSLLFSLFSTICLAQTNSSFRPYIIGGQNATAYQFPFFAHIQVSTSTYSGGCGGSLITPTLVLTAAHCCGCSDPTISFMVAINAFSANVETNAAIPDSCTDTFFTTTKQCHPGYQEGGDTVHPENDFCLLTLPSPSTYPPITLYDSSTIQVSPRLDSYNYQLLIIGFGIKDFQPVGSPTLQKAFQRVADSSLCALRYSIVSSGQISINTDLIMCGNTSNLTNTCQGDSGGPIFTKTNGKFVLVGVTSGGVGDCYDTTYDALYGRVDTDSFKNWLRGAITKAPTGRPTRIPSNSPSTRSPTGRPSRRPTISPSVRPTKRPTIKPTTRLPTVRPTTKTPTTRAPFPTGKPTKNPTSRPTRRPTNSPTSRPSKYPTPLPTARPSKVPSLFPSRRPSESPTARPTRVPTFAGMCINPAYP